MHIYLLRHGDAVDSTIDPARPLSDAGREEIARVANFVAHNGLKVAQVWHSEKLRAEQTAQLLNELGGLNAPLEMRSGLLPNDDVTGIAAELEAENESIAVVGHLPHLNYLAAQLLCGPGSAPFSEFYTGSLMCLERQGPGVYALDWFVKPAILGA